MNESLDLTKVLAGCPAGTKFYSSIYGEVSFIEIDTSDVYPIKLEAYDKSKHLTEYIYYAQEGIYFYAYDGECTLFPSRDQRDWAKFERFWDRKVKRFDPHTLHPFDKILARDANNHIWECALLSHIDYLNEEYKVITVGSCYVWCIPYNEETKHLVGTTNDCPEFYKWWEE